MKTIDTHTHLLNPGVSFNRLFDRVALRLFAKGLGMEPARLMVDPYETYVSALAQSIKESGYVEKACLFGVDSRLDERGREIHRDPTVCAMTEDVLAVSARYPELFIPFLSVNPRRPGALELIDQYAERGCRGAKFLQNYWGIDLNDEALIPYYERLMALRIPLIIHVGSEYSIHSFARYEGVDMLDLPLATGLTVIAAHMGLGSVHYRWRFWRNLSRNPAYFDPDYFTLLDLLHRHDNLYADIAAILAPLRARALRHLSQQRDIHHKLLFATDYPVPFTTGLNSYDLNAATRRRIGEIKNPFDRYTAAILEFFSEDSPLFENHRRVLPIR